METFNVDFTGVSNNENKFYVEPGMYNVKITNVTKGKKEGSEYPYLMWEFKLLDNDELALNVVTSLSPKALFKLKELLEAVGLTVPEGTLKINPSDYLGKIAKAEITDREYNGKVYSNIVKLHRASTSDSSNSIDDIL